MRRGTIVFPGLLLLAFSGLPARGEEPKPAAPAPSLVAPGRRGSTVDAIRTFADLDRLVYSPLRSGARSITADVHVVGRDGKFERGKPGYLLTAKPPDSLKVASTIDTDIPNLPRKDLAPLKEGIGKTERKVMRILRRHFGLLRPPPGIKCDAEVQPLGEGKRMLIVTLYDDGKPAERDFLTLDAGGMPVLMEFTDAAVDFPPSVPGAGPGGGKGGGGKAAPSGGEEEDVLTWIPRWEKGEKGSRLTGWGLYSRGKDPSKAVDCALHWAPHGALQVPAAYRMAGGGQILLTALKVDGKSVDLSSIPPAEAPAPKDGK